MKHILGVLVISLFVPFSQAFAQQTTDVFVDQQGVMRWGTSRAEVQGFGVNYTVPFAHAYRTALKMGISLEKAIDDDVYHFARLGFDSYRVHVWDTEISDSLGNLIDNEHLRLFDYMLKKMKDRGIKSVLTPIAYWGNGWPEPDEKTPGFSHKYGKAACLTNPDAIKAQENYLYQFLNHVNRYTGIAYKNDPDVIAFEISNEPHHGGEAAKVTEFINRMVASMRKTGCKKPIFYNISHSVHLADGYFKADIQGGTFQWYPTGLGSRHELRGNLLPNVERYTIPFANDPRFKKMAKIVYEFDAADVGRSYIYPAMARSFRQAGMQLAHQFAYDPTYMAPANTEYDTHFMNLVYAPQKALSLMLAAEVFHRVPMYKDYGRFPVDTLFEGFRVSYQQDLAELVTDTKFIYTNTTTTKPTAPDKLDQVSGFGQSAVVTYEGKGAYFLDRLEKGVWRLEVLPDAIWVHNLFGRNSPKKANAVVNWRSWPISITLPDLGSDYTITALNAGNPFTATNSSNGFTVSPGSYLLVKRGTTTKLTGDSRWKNITLKEFTAPATTVTKTYVLHQPVIEASAGVPLKLDATIVSAEAPESVEALVIWGTYRPERIKLQKSTGYIYSATLPDRLMREGFLKYYLLVTEKGKTTLYPSGTEGTPSSWDFYDPQQYQTRIVPQTNPIELFNAQTDADEVSRTWTPGSGLMPAYDPGNAELQLAVDKLFIPDPENKNGEKLYDYSFRYNFRPKLAGRQSDVSQKQTLVFHGRSLVDNPFPLQLALVTKDGTVYGGTIPIGTKTGDYALPISQLKPVKFVSLPRPYPGFLPYFIDTNTPKSLSLTDIETIQFSIGPGIATDQREQKFKLGIQSVRLE